MEKKYDVMVIGRYPLIIILITREMSAEKSEGAVVASGFAAAGSGVRTAVFCKSNEKDADIKERFAGIQADLYWSPSSATCSIRNQYFTADKESVSVLLWESAIPSVCGDSSGGDKGVPFRRSGIWGF